MIDDQDAEGANGTTPRRTPPPPRRKPAPRRTPPPRRGSNGNGATTNAGGDDPIATLIRQNQELLARLERVEAGSVRYIESEPEPMADARAVNPESMHPFTRKLWEERTHDVPLDFGGDTEPSYNIPQRLYLKSDGTYAWLQGDHRSRGYYVQKGYYCLSADEVAEYEKLKPGIVAEQREKAHLITTIRRLIDTDAALAGHRGDNDADAELDLMSVPQLHQTWQALCAETTQPDRKLPSMKRFRSEGRDRQMDGVETAPSRSRMREFETEQESTNSARRGGRLVEVNASNARQFPV